ncbi:MAG: sugar ABC transporter permease [Phycisphaerae bacterium]|nr:sugar ABC transporter permease [Phycisphaerae bacterium]
MPETGAKRGSAWGGWGLIAFPMAVLTVFTLAPTAAGLALSVFEWDGSSAPVFIGARHYAGLLADERFGPALRNTLIFALAGVPLSVLAGFALALACDAPWFRGRAVVRTLLFLPQIVSVAATGLMWRWLLDGTGGALPGALRSAGIAAPDFLQAGWWPLASLIVIGVWRQAGFCMVLYLAALSNVSRSLYEAGRVDGAGSWGLLRHVTWPQAMPMTGFLTLTGLISALQVFDLVIVLVGDVESPATATLNVLVFREFRQGRLGYASAIGTMIFALTMTVTALGLLRPRARAAGRGGGA